MTGGPSHPLVCFGNVDENNNNCIASFPIVSLRLSWALELRTVITIISKAYNKICYETLNTTCNMAAVLKISSLQTKNYSQL